MSTDSTPVAPVGQSQRINSMDILRGISLLGILLLNIVGFGLPHPSYSNPTVMGGATGINLFAWEFNSLFFEGTMRAIFSMLFGAGVILFTFKAEEKGAGLKTADLYYRRTIWLLIFGIVHAYLLLWPGEILYSYGLMGLLLFPMRKLAPRTLIIAACALISTGMLLDHMDYKDTFEKKEKAQLAASQLKSGQTLNGELSKAEESWKEVLEEHSPPPENLEEKITYMNGGYWEVVAYLAPVNKMIQTSFSYRYDLWDILSMMLLGMALFKIGILKAEKSYRYYLVLALIGYFIGIGINYYETSLIINNNFDVLAFADANRTYGLGRLFTVLGHVGLIMIFCKLPMLLWLKHSLSAVGRMAFTNYIMHTLICNAVFLGIGFGLYGQLERYQLYYVVFAIWIFQLALSPVWLHYFRFGPLEWAWRSLTYKKLQPFRIRKLQPEMDLGGAIS